MVGLLGSWVLAWQLRQVLPPLNHLQEFLWWLIIKGVLWVVPVVALVRWRHGHFFAWMGLNHLQGLGVGFLLSALWFFVNVPLVPGMRPGPVSLISSVLFTPVLEEVLFRGYALGRLREGGWSHPVANLIAATGFSLLHLPGWIQMGKSPEYLAIEGVKMLVFGGLFGLIARDRSLWVAVLAHALHNLVASGLFGR